MRQLDLDVRFVEVHLSFGVGNHDVGYERSQNFCEIGDQVLKVQMGSPFSLQTHHTVRFTQDSAALQRCGLKSLIELRET